MSLTSYRAAPPRGCLVGLGCRARLALVALRGLGGPVRCGGCPHPEPDEGHPADCVYVGLCFADEELRFGCVGAPFGRPGGDLLSRALRRSTIGAEGFHGRVRNGIGCLAPRHDHQVIEAELEKTCALPAMPLARDLPRERIGLGSSQTSD